MAAEGRPGTVLSTEGGLLIACGDGAIRVSEIQLQGKRRMPFGDFLRGAAGLFEGDDDLTLGVGP